MLALLAGGRRKTEGLAMIVTAGRVVGVGVLGGRVLARGGRWLAVGLVVGVWWLAGAGGALAAPPAFTPVTGSPFATGLAPCSVAFSPGGGLLATANAAAKTVSVFSVAPPTASIGAPIWQTYTVGQVVAITSRVRICGRSGTSSEDSTVGSRVQWIPLLWGEPFSVGVQPGWGAARDRQ